MATLATIRASLNSEIGVLADADTIPWTQAVRNDAISKGYAALWIEGVGKPVIEDETTVDAQAAYAITTIQRVAYAEVIGSSGGIVESPPCEVVPNGSGGYQAIVPGLAAGYTLRLHGYAPYISTFATDAAVDDIETEWARVPLLKAKEILYRQELGRVARFQERQAAPSGMSVGVSDLLAVIAAAKREWDEMIRLMRRRQVVRGQATHRSYR
jgi:hypothetical protein